MPKFMLSVNWTDRAVAEASATRPRSRQERGRRDQASFTSPSSTKIPLSSSRIPTVTYWAAPIALLAALAFATPAAAASFDCGKASHPDEHVICSNQDLSNMDVEMATLFRVRMELPMLMGSRGAARDEQHDWLATRSACGGNVACLTAAYKTRIDQLNGTIADAMKDYCVKMGIC